MDANVNRLWVLMSNVSMHLNTSQLKTSKSLHESILQLEFRTDLKYFPAVDCQ